MRPVMLSYTDVTAARQRIGDRVHRTPTLSATRVGARAGVQLRLKCESLQRTGSFKVRGALNAVSQLTPEQRARGVVSVSAGNHAAALGWAATAVGVQCTVVMPAAAMQSKVDASRAYGANVILHGVSSEAFELAHQLAAEHNYVFVHPFDDIAVAAGAGTVGLEILEDAPDVEAIIVPVGGGGLLAGIAVAVKHANPSVRIYGVEPEGAAALRLSLDAGKMIRVVPNTIADGLAPSMTGEIPFEVARRCVDDIVLVSDAQIAEAMGVLLSSSKLLAEPAGAAATAALLSGKIRLPKNARVVSVLSGANVGIERLKELI